MDAGTWHVGAYGTGSRSSSVRPGDHDGRTDERLEALLAPLRDSGRVVLVLALVVAIGAFLAGKSAGATKTCGASIRLPSHSAPL